MTNPMIRIHNSETNEVIDREMTDDELIQHNKDIAESEKVRNDFAAKL